MTTPQDVRKAIRTHIQKGTPEWSDVLKLATEAEYTSQVSHSTPEGDAYYDTNAWQNIVNTRGLTPHQREQLKEAITR